MLKPIWIATVAALALAACTQEPSTGPASQAGTTLPAPVAATSAAAPSVAATDASAFSFDGLTGGTINLAEYRGKAVLVVNTASQCGFTSQLGGLQTLHEARGKDGLVVIGVPSNDFGGQEPGSAGEIASFCELNYGVTFPMAGKQQVIGPAAHPFYAWAASVAGNRAMPHWNFHKILIGRDGTIQATFPSAVAPSSPELEAAVTAALAG
jgi:glutathione peroxidase